MESAAVDNECCDVLVWCQVGTGCSWANDGGWEARIPVSRNIAFSFTRTIAWDGAGDKGCRAKPHRKVAPADWKAAIWTNLELARTGNVPEKQESADQADSKPRNTMW